MWLRLQALDAEREKFDREMLVHGKALSEEEFRRLMQQHKQNMGELESSYESEKERQRKALEKKVLYSMRSSLQAPCQSRTR